MRRCLRRNTPGPVSDPGRDQRGAQRRRRPPPTPTGARSLALYDQLLAIAPNPIVALNRAVAVAEVEGPAPALAAVDALDLDTYHLFHSTRAELLARLHRYDEAGAEYDRAIALAGNVTERALLEQKRHALPPP